MVTTNSHTPRFVYIYIYSTVLDLQNNNVMAFQKGLVKLYNTCLDFIFLKKKKTLQTEESEFQYHLQLFIINLSNNYNYMGL
jgi:hypothetical protein